MQKTSSSSDFSKTIELKTEYYVTSSYFDPISGSPPNDFMDKLHQRMSTYFESSSSSSSTSTSSSSSSLDNVDFVAMAFNFGKR
jgi:hypothetical protein